MCVDGDLDWVSIQQLHNDSVWFPLLEAKQEMHHHLRPPEGVRFDHKHKSNVSNGRPTHSCSCLAG
jgi:hypothetical protein